MAGLLLWKHNIPLVLMSVHASCILRSPLQPNTKYGRCQADICQMGKAYCHINQNEDNPG